MPPAFIDIQRRLVDALMRMPVMDDFAGRSSLLQGLPPAPLVRSAAVARLDLNNIVSGLQQMGRLTDQGGARPVIVVVDNALAYLPPQSEVAQTLNEGQAGTGAILRRRVSTSAPAYAGRDVGGVDLRAAA